jgi:cytoskeletal protein CcmA (bactofilin family)
MSDISLISHSTTVRGNISGDGSLHVEGRVRGDISVTGDVILGPQAQVAGNITGATITVDGALEGDINASVALSVGSSAKVVGDLTAPNIGIEEGALVRGRIETEGVGTPVAQPRGRTSSATLGRAPIARRGDLGRSDLGRGDLGRGDLGRGDLGRGDLGRGDLGRGDLGRGDSIASRDGGSRFVAPRAAVSAPRREAPVTVQTPVKAVAAPVPSLSSGQTELTSEAKAKKLPPPPVVTAPRKGAKGRKKAAKRE